MTGIECIWKNKERLDNEFKKKYPNGQILVKKWNDGYCYVRWSPRRRTSHTTPLGISNAIASESTEVHDGWLWNECSVNSTHVFAKLEDAIVKMNKLKFPEKLISRFTYRYNNRKQLMEDYVLAMRNPK